MRKETLNKLFWIAFLALPARASAQTDPLSSSYMPAINTNASQYPANIWITGPLAKVRQNDATTSSGTTHWAIVYAAQNEFQSFQVHVHASSSISHLNVSMSDLVNAQTGTHISAASTNIVVYTEAYMDITNITASNSPTYFGVTGYYPDILIPAVDPYYRQTITASTVAVTAGNNQSFWIDVHVPPTAPSGYYAGNVTVKNGNVILSTMPVVYAVWAWQMPATATLLSAEGMIANAMCQQAYGGEPNCASYPGAQGSNNTGEVLSQIDLAVLSLDHRTSMITALSYPATLPTASPYSYSSFEQYYAPLLNGTAANTETILQGAKANTVSGWFNTSISSPAAQSAINEFTNKGWASTLFDYIRDEPSSASDWAAVIANASGPHSSSPHVPTLVTTDMANASANNATSDIDWMVVNIVNLDPYGGSGPNQSTYSSWLAANPIRKLFSYGSCNSGGCTAQPFYPNYDVDGTPVANRAMEWLTYLHGQTGELYYNSTICWTSSCGPSSNITDPWKSVYYAGGNGDGTLVYPGTNAKIGVTDPIYLPSIRLKMMRDGFQDYEYLHALNAAGQGSFVTTQIDSWIKNSYTFNNDPNNNGAFSGTITAARQALGTKLHQLTYPPGTSNAAPPTVPAGLSAVAVSSTQINLSWTASTGSAGVTGYKVFRGGVQVATPTAASYSDTGLIPSTTYTYTISAFATAGVSGLSAAVSAVTLPPPPISASLQAAYGFDEGSGKTTADASVNDSAGALNGTVAWTTAGKYGDALSFSGTTGYVEAPAIAALSPGTSATFEAWVFLSSAPSEIAAVIDRWSQTIDDEYLFGINSNRTLFFGWQSTAGGGVWGGTGYNDASGTGAVPLKAWTHIAAVRSGAILNFYLNGNLDVSLTVMDGNSFRNGINTLRIGGEGRGGEPRFINGTIDEVRIYNQALTQSQIQTDMITPIAGSPVSPPPDTTPPSVPAGLAAVAVSSSQINLSWTASTDNVGVAGYKVFLGSVQIATQTTTALSDTGLLASTTYTYTVSAFDAAGNVSAHSSPVSATTLAAPRPPDTTPPSVSITSPDNGEMVSGTIVVSVAAEDNVGVTKVEFFINGALIATDTAAPYSFNWNTLQSTNSTYTLSAKGYDAAGNVGSASITVNVNNRRRAK